MKPNEPADIVCDQGSKPSMRTLIQLWFLIKTKNLNIVCDQGRKPPIRTFNRIMVSVKLMEKTKTLFVIKDANQE